MSGMGGRGEMEERLGELEHQRKRVSCRVGLGRKGRGCRDGRRDEER